MPILLPARSSSFRNQRFQSSGEMATQLGHLAVHCGVFSSWDALLPVLPSDDMCFFVFLMQVLPLCTLIVCWVPSALWHTLHLQCLVYSPLLGNHRAVFSFCAWNFVLQWLGSGICTNPGLFVVSLVYPNVIRLFPIVICLYSVT